MTTQLSHKTRLGVNKNNDKAFVVWSKTWARYAGRCSGAARRARTWERDNYIVYYHALGVQIKELADELELHRNTIARIVGLHTERLLNLWGMWQRIKAKFLPKYRLAHIVKNRTAAKFFKDFNKNFATRAWGWASHWKGKVFYEKEKKLCIETMHNELSFHRGCG